MTLLQNLAATTSADLIGNDANPTLTISNTSTGIGLKIVGSSSAVSATAGAALQIGFSANVAGATVAPVNIIASTASQAVLSISGVFMSTASINVAQSQSAFVIPIYHATQAVWGYVSASKGVA